MSTPAEPSYRQRTGYQAGGPKPYLEAIADLHDGLRETFD